MPATLFIGAIVHEQHRKMHDLKFKVEDEKFFTNINKKAEEELERMRQRMTDWRIPKPVRALVSLPYIYWIGKYHKEGLRVIGAAPSTIITELSRLVADVLNFFLNQLMILDLKRYRRTGVKKFFVIRRFEEFTKPMGNYKFKEVYEFVNDTTLAGLSRAQLDRLKEETEAMYCADFSNMYTNIDQADLKTKLTEIITELFKQAGGDDWRTLGVEWETNAGKGKSSVQWNKQFFKNNPRLAGVREQSTRAHSKRKHLFSLEQFIDILQWVIGQAYALNGDYLIHQVRGIPMGANYGPPMADLYLLAYEFQYVSKPPRPTKILVFLPLDR